MSAKTDPPSSGSAGSSDTPARTRGGSAASAGAAATNPPVAPGAESASSNAPRRKPRISLFIATACGLGYLPKAPGTWGSLAGLVLAMLPFWGSLAALSAITASRGQAMSLSFTPNGVDAILCTQIGLAIVVGAIGLFSSTAAAKFWGVNDPQRVVVDEVSGQHLTLLLGCALPIWRSTPGFPPNVGLGLITAHSALNWKYLLLGFILFRVFDIWKPFPARQAESLPGGWGIMADDWIAGIYAGLGLWIARALGL